MPTTTTTTTRYYTLGGLKQQKCIFSRSWRLEVQDQGAGRAGFFWGVCPSCCVLVRVSLCVCVWILISFSYKDTVTPDQGHLLGYTWRPTSPVAQLWDQRKTAGTMTETSSLSDRGPFKSKAQGPQEFCCHSWDDPASRPGHEAAVRPQLKCFSSWSPGFLRHQTRRPNLTAQGTCIL